MELNQPRTIPEARGYLLARAREARGWTPSEMARQLRKLGSQRGLPVAPGRDGIWYWEHDRTPDRPTQLLIAELLGLPLTAVDERPWPEWLSEDPAQRPTARPWTLLGAAASLHNLAGSTMELARRDLILIAGGTLTASLLAWLTADSEAVGQLTASRRRVGEAAVARIEQRAQMLRRMDDEDGGGTILAESSSALALVNGMLRGYSYTDDHGARLYAAASDLARQRGAALFDVKGQCADSAYETALRTASAAQDAALGANCLSFWCVAAYNTGRLRDAETMASAAVAAVRGRTTPRVEAMLYSRRGRARAHLADSRCWQDFDRAEELLAQAGGHADPDWSYWFDQAEILGARASSHLDMNQPASAENDFAQAQALFAPSVVRTQTLYLARQGSAQFAQGHVEEACATANAALDLAECISSQRSTAPLLDLADRLTTYSIPAARDYRERVRVVLAA